MSSNIIIVDSRDQEIGTKERGEVQLEDIYRVAGLWVLNEKDEVLLARRAFTKSHDPGKWGTSVAGTVEEGETYESNIKKEAQEELGLLATDLQTGVCEFVQGKHQFFCQWFYMVVPSDTAFTLQEEEVAEVRWWSREELAQAVAQHPEDFIASMAKAIVHLP
jgi:NAD+ diphosphatase